MGQCFSGGTGGKPSSSEGNDHHRSTPPSRQAQRVEPLNQSELDVRDRRNSPVQEDSYWLEDNPRGFMTTELRKREAGTRKLYGEDGVRP